MTRGCEHCGTSFQRRPHIESASRFRQRHYCSVRCATDGRVQQQHGVQLARVKRALAYDPDLEVWQLVERFGVHESTADQWRQRYRRAS